MLDRYLIFCALLFGSGALHAQRNAAAHSYVLEVEAGDSLGSLIQKLSSKKLLHFAYAPELMSLKPSQLGMLKGENVEVLFNRLFPKQIVTKTISQNQILLRTSLESTPVEGQPLSFQLVDEDDLRPLADVIVFLEPSSFQTISDAGGNVIIPQSNKNQGGNIYFYRLGYETLSLDLTALRDGQQLALNSEPIQIDSIIVTSKLPSTRVYENSIKIGLQPGSIWPISNAPAGEDLLKSFQILPGIKADDDQSAELKIRGSEGNETLILLDGIPIYKSEHYYGIFSNINANYIHEATLYKNIIPVQFDGKTGGMLSLVSAPTPDRASGSLESNLIYSSLNFNAPIGDQWGISLAGRSSYLNAARSQIFDFVQNSNQAYRGDGADISRDRILKSDPYFNFYDGNAKISFQPTDKTKIDLNFFTSRDDFSNDYDLTFLSAPEDVQRLNTEILRNGETWINQGAALNLSQDLMKDWTLYGNVHYSKYESNGNIRSMLQQQSPNFTAITAFSNIQKNEISEKGGFLLLQREVKNTELKLGFSLKGVENVFQLEEDDLLILSGGGQSLKSTAFASYRKQIKNLSWSLGGRFIYYSGTKQPYFDPNFQLTYSINDLIMLKAAAGNSHQFVRELNYENRLTQAINYFVLAEEGSYPVGTSFNSMFGLTLKKSDWFLDVEFYKKDLGGVLNYALAMPGFTNGVGPSRSHDYRSFLGSGEVLGADVLFNLQLKKYTSVLTYTLSRSTRQLDQVRSNLSFAAPDDRRHQLQSTHRFDLGKFSLSGSYIFSSGKPYLDIANVTTGADRRQFTRRQFISRLPSYQRIDFGVDYKFEISRVQAILGLSVFNLTNHGNVKYLQYIYAIPTPMVPNGTASSVVGTEVELLPQTFNISLTLSF